MKLYLIPFLCLPLMFSACRQTMPGKDTYVVQIVDFEGLRPYLARDTDSVYLVNFWATWCKPCVDEMPYFEAMQEKYKDQKLKVLMVSLDNPDHLETRVIPFINENNIQNEVLLLDDLNANYWIPEVDDRWSGAIPATVYYGKNFREFYEKAFKLNELDSIVKSKL